MPFALLTLLSVSKKLDAALIGAPTDELPQVVLAPPPMLLFWPATSLCGANTTAKA